MTLFDRYVFWETLQLLTVGTLVILGIFFGTVEFTNVMEMMSKSGMPLQTVLVVMALQLPTGMSYCLPAGVVVSIMLVLARASRDSEIVALQLLGVSLLRIVAPFLAIGFIASACCFYISENVAPQTRDLSRRFFAISANKTERPFANQFELRFEPAAGHVEKIMLVGKGQGATVTGFVSFDLSKAPMVKLVYAQTAEWKNYSWTLHDGRLFELLNGDAPAVQMQFAEMQLPAIVDPSEIINSHYRSTLEHTRSELKEILEVAKLKQIEVPGYLKFQYYRRYSHPLSCFFLALAAAPLVLLRRRKGRDFSMLYCAFTIVAFFIGQQISMALVVNDRLDPMVAAWLPVSVLASLGMLLACLLRR
jgi:lipopolysaccharide export system permease protein